MTISTNHGNFHGFQSVEIFMRTENIESIDILNVVWMGQKITLPMKTHTYADILEILK